MLPILISIPHASNFVPSNIRKKMRLSDTEISSYSDLYTDEIYNIPSCHQVVAQTSRLVVDTNRAPDDLIIESRLAHEGVVVQVAEDGRSIYKDGVSTTEKGTSGRVKKYHDTFHHEIETLAPKCKFLIDAHSYMSIGPSTKIDVGVERADIGLGNRGYSTCSHKQTDFFSCFFEKLGYSVSINSPYGGEYILGYHCHRNKFPGILIEIKRSLYMNEKTLEPYKDQIHKINIQLSDLIQAFCKKI